MKDQSSLSPDEIFVERLRRAHLSAEKWNWLLIVFTISLDVSLLILSFNHEPLAFSRALKTVTGTIPAWMYYVHGLIQGTMLSLAFLLTVYVFCIQFVSMRTARLLLDYHDRLRQAGLLTDAESKSGAESPVPTGNP